jgi:hypothetical protein
MDDRRFMVEAGLCTLREEAHFCVLGRDFGPRAPYQMNGLKQVVEFHEKGPHIVAPV